MRKLIIVLMVLFIGNFCLGNFIINDNGIDDVEISEDKVVVYY